MPENFETETSCDHDSPATMSVPQDTILPIPAPQQRVEEHYIARSGRTSNPPEKYTPQNSHWRYYTWASGLMFNFLFLFLKTIDLDHLKTKQKLSIKTFYDRENVMLCGLHVYYMLTSCESQTGHIHHCI